MAIRKYKPTTPGRRGSSRGRLRRGHPRPRRRSRWSARCTTRAAATTPGKITTRHQGGGHKRAYRVIDFRRHDKDGVPAKVAHIEYDPNRTARIALLHYADGEKRYILAPRLLKQGDRDRERAERRHQAGQRPAAAQHPGRHGRARHRAAARRRREDRPLGRRQRAARRQGRPVRPAAHALRRDPQRRRALPRHRRRGRQRRAVATSTGARPAACAGRASARPSAVSP